MRDHDQPPVAQPLLDRPQQQIIERAEVVPRPLRQRVDQRAQMIGAIAKSADLKVKLCDRVGYLLLAPEMSHYLDILVRDDKRKQLPIQAEILNQGGMRAKFALE